VKEYILYLNQPTIKFLYLKLFYLIWVKNVFIANLMKICLCKKVILILIIYFSVFIIFLWLKLNLTFSLYYF